MIAIIARTVGLACLSFILRMNKEELLGSDTFLSGHGHQSRKGSGAKLVIVTE
jgi:hypothetical protein